MASSPSSSLGPLRQKTLPLGLTATLLLLLLLLLVAPTATLAQQQQEGAAEEEIDLLATLDYGTFQGAYSSTYNISYWQKIPFAQPPVGPLRFRGPQPPLPVTNNNTTTTNTTTINGSGIYNSTQPFDMCVQRTVNGSEDCLYLGLYTRPWTTRPPQPLRPVVVVFYGGAYIEGSASFTSLPPSAYPILNVSKETELVFVYPNYRTNAFGFLPGREVAADRAGSDLNPGLLDQEAAIKWTKKYISHFGGDPSQIAIWGQSAGGGSVVAQVIAHAGQNNNTNNTSTNTSTTTPLFTRALASSPFWAKTYDYDAPEAQAIYDTFSTLVGCGTGPTSLACLKTADVQAMRDAALVIDASHTYNTSSYTWAPVIDGRFLTKRLSEVQVGEVNVEYAWGMYNTHEGENFIPPGLADPTNTGGPPSFNDTTASFDTWLAGFLPSLSADDLATVRQLYPAVGNITSSTGTGTLASYNSSYTRAGLIYRDTVLACPAYWTAGVVAGGGEHGYLGEYSISPATHGSDTIWWNSVNAVQKTEPDIYHGYTGAFASFFETGDPNALKLTGANDTGVPPLSSGHEFNINADGFAQIDLTQFKTRCDYWRSVAAKIPI